MSRAPENTAGSPVLRLVRDVAGAEPAAAFGRRFSPAARPVASIADRRIARENTSAATLPEADARVIFAREVAASIEGGRAAILRPDSRRALVQRARAIGLRPFDAQLVIAIVQEAAQRTMPSGDVVATATPNLAAVGGQTGETPGEQSLRLAIVAVGLGIFALGLVIAWMGA